MTAQAEDWLTISIATKDRPEVLEATLRRLHDFGLGNCELLVCDDGSSLPLVPKALQLFPRGRLLRNTKPVGQALARNRIAQECTGRYILQLDDDSYPVAGTLDHLLREAGAATNWLAFAIPFVEPARGRHDPYGLAPSGTRLRAFVGCSALINRQTFLRIGGYAPWIGRTVEEDELCIRAFREGLYVFAANEPTICHAVSPEGRSLAGIEQRSFRNWMLTWMAYAPFAQLILRSAVLLLRASWIMLRFSRTTALEGFFSGVLSSGCVITNRRPLTTAQYTEYCRLAHPLS